MPKRVRKPIRVVKDAQTGLTFRSRTSTFSLREHLELGLGRYGAVPEAVQDIIDRGLAGGRRPQRQHDPAGAPAQGFFPPAMQLDNYDLPPEEDPLAPPQTGTSASKRAVNARELDEYLPTFASTLGTGIRICLCTPHDLVPVPIYCIGINESKVKLFKLCKCKTRLTSLISQGYFPSAPLRAQTALSLQLLRFFRHLWHNAKPTKDGFAAALAGFHREDLRLDLRDYKEHLRKTMYFYFRCLSMAETMRAEAVIAAGLGLPLAIRHNTLAERCPADFYRVGCPDFDRPWIIGIDGNQQHWRFKHASANDIPPFTTELFVHVPEKDRATSQKAKNPVTDLCAHNFKAAGTKPPSMQKCDETGLFAVICRHDAPLRLMNSYAGERFDWIVHLIQSFIDAAKLESGLDNDTILTYDVACRLQPYLEVHHKDLAKRMRVVVNKFHGMAHELRCQMVYGAIWEMLLAETDGEGPERVWSLLKFLVAPGRESSAPSRMLLLEDRSDWLCMRKRLTLGMILFGRYEKAKTSLQRQDARLGTILDKTITVQRSAGAEPQIVLVTRDLLLQEHKSQRDYFYATKSRKLKHISKIYDSILAERKLEGEIQHVNAMLQGGAVNAAQHTALLKAKSDALSAAIKATDELLETNKQTREHWRVDGPLWRESCRKNNPEKDIYGALLAEKSTQLQVGSMDAAAYQHKLQGQEATTDAILYRMGQSREDWAENGLLWLKYSCASKIQSLETLYGDILGVAASRALELRNLKARCMGNKQAKKVLGALVSRYPTIGNKIKRFNAISQTLPDPYKPPLLDKAAFQDADIDAAPEKDGSEALWFLEMLRSELLDTTVGVPKGLWPYSAKVRFGIEALFRRDRAEEELQLVGIEFRRLVAFFTERIETILRCIETPPMGYERLVFYDWLWKEIPALESIVDAAPRFGDASFAYPTVVELLATCKAKIGALTAVVPPIEGPLDEEQTNQAMQDLERDMIGMNMKNEDEIEEGVLGDALDQYQDAVIV